MVDIIFIIITIIISKIFGFRWYYSIIIGFIFTGILLNVIWKCEICQNFMSCKTFVNIQDRMSDFFHTVSRYVPFFDKLVMIPGSILILFSSKLYPVVTNTKK